MDELVPKALKVLNAHLDKGGPDAWRAALRIFEHQYGRAPEQPEEPLVIPDNIEDVEKLSWGQLLYLAGSTPMTWTSKAPARRRRRPCRTSPSSGRLSWSLVAGPGA